MAGASSLLLLVICHLSLLSWAEDLTGFNPKCPSLPCRYLGNISFPFTDRTHPECGLLMVDNCTDQLPTIQLGKDGPRFYIVEIRQDSTVVLGDQVNAEHSKKLGCGSLENFTLSSSPFYSFEIPSNVTIFKCINTTLDNPSNFPFKVCNDSSSIISYNLPTDKSSSPPVQCSVIQPQVIQTQNSVLLHNIFTGLFVLQVNVTAECFNCHSRRGRCQSGINGKFICSGAETGIKIYNSKVLGFAHG
ncbi:hypothetical protein Ddye_030027 [Dipteronia dyeriana]|uniref:Wall-associated receptor kinase galacturonan-binding domain-containing protein n=1 Tax=Dipteronia dyeriana TaxID=168575 RepID=A0AAD9WMA1_9ROSI|nr:hypothetical protein Ddye_030027 [Dipteronia dyeriana]